MFLSVVVPVYNRPTEVEDLLRSLSEQTYTQFEVVIVEDGSSVTCLEEVNSYKSKLRIRYFFKPNSGPGLSRNFGFEKIDAAAKYVIFVDSDCVLPSNYLTLISEFLLANHHVDVFGGPDAAHDSFTSFQKAVNYSMTSWLTTGGIRGGGEQVDKFYPRSFNMGVSVKAFKTVNGFANMRFGEDIDLSLRLMTVGFKPALIKAAFVYHKRRVTLKAFFKQVFNSGMARVVLLQKHKQALKLVHVLPAVFVLFCAYSVVWGLIKGAVFWGPLEAYALLLFVHAWFKTKRFALAGLCVLTSYTQLLGYGSGFLTGLYQAVCRGKKQNGAFLKRFYD